jgi:hypothetical protein
VLVTTLPVANACHGVNGGAGEQYTLKRRTRAKAAEAIEIVLQNCLCERVAQAPDALSVRQPKKHWVARDSDPAWQIALSTSRLLNLGLGRNRIPERCSATGSWWLGMVRSGLGAALLHVSASSLGMRIRL